VIAENG